MTRERKQFEAWLDATTAEIVLRQAAKLEAAEDNRQRPFRILDEMRERLSQAPGYIEATPAEREQALAELELWFREHGYALDDLRQFCASNRQQTPLLLALTL